MKLEVVDFYYFSGTGNTLLAVNAMRQIFSDNGVEVTLFRLEKSNPLEINLNHAIGIAFPVAAQGTYPFVWDFINALPETDGTFIFMLDTLAAFSGGIVGPVKKIVRKKGYCPIGSKEIVMPTNFFPGKINKEKNERKISKGLKRAESYADDLLSGTAEWRRIPILSDLLAFCSRNQRTWRTMRWYFNLRVEESKCVKCGLCSQLCPNQNIEMNEYPEFKNQCVTCMRCITFCPNEAIHSKKNKHEKYRTVSERELLQLQCYRE